MRTHFAKFIDDDSKIAKLLDLKDVLKGPNDRKALNILRSTGKQDDDFLNSSIRNIYPHFIHPKREANPKLITFRYLLYVSKE
jgi:hypothetical protein